MIYFEVLTRVLLDRVTKPTSTYGMSVLRLRFELDTFQSGTNLAISLGQFIS